MEPHRLYFYLLMAIFPFTIFLLGAMLFYTHLSIIDMTLYIIVIGPLTGISSLFAFYRLFITEYKEQTFSDSLFSTLQKMNLGDGPHDFRMVNGILLLQKTPRKVSPSMLNNHQLWLEERNKRVRINDKAETL
jgi:hypothetical protein